MKANFLSDALPRILIVDDDEVMRLLLRQFLEGEHYAVSESDNGYSALETLAEERFDLVILDIAMPGIDGPTVSENITTSFVNPPPVLMITALDDENTIDRSFSAGAVDYIRKPIRWPVLKNRIRYILGSHRAKIELELLSKNYEMILDAAANGICGVDAAGYINYINPSGLAMLGCDKNEMILKHYKEFFKLSSPGSNDFDVESCPYFQDPDSTEAIHFDEYRLVRKDGSSFPVDFSSTPIIQHKELMGGVLVYQDITEKQEAAELIRFMANHDSLTNLPNRNYFTRRLPQAISLAKRYNRKLFLLFIDLDRFKPINDTYGHGMGDQVLVQVAKRLRVTLRSSDSVCRLGGDEFVILIESTDSREGAVKVANKAIELLNEPIEVDRHVCFIGASIGISVYPDDCDDAETMLRQADIAMYRAKKSGRNCYNFYQPAPSDKAK